MNALALLLLLSLQAEKPPAFEVASVRPIAATSTGSDFEDGRRAGMASVGMKVTGRRASATFNDLKQLICQAYALQAHQVFAPDWAASRHFDIAATLPAGGAADQAPAMLRTLLAERFDLKAHVEPREIPAYVLVVGKGGVKMSEAGAAAAPPGTATEVAARGRVGVAPAGMHLRRPSINTTDLAQLLTRFADRPVVDMTGLTGKYLLDLTFTMRDDPDLPSLFTAMQEQLGLKLEARKVKMDVLVVDHLEQNPKEN